jgi:aminoglycoside phosphotransferase (APT) family kinase protein
MIGSALNRVRRVAQGGGWVVRREWAPPAVAAMLGIDPAAEVAAQQFAAVHGLAPPVLEFDLQAGFMLMPFVEGSRLETDWPRHSARRAAMHDLLQRLRALRRPPLPPLDLHVRARELYSRLARRAPSTAERWQQHFADYLHPAAASCGAPSPHVSPSPRVAEILQPVLVHGDLGPHNVLVRADGSLCLLDWEYAHSGHDDEDLAGLLAGLSRADAAAAGLEGWSVEPERLEDRLRLRRLLDGLWRELVAVGLEPGWQDPADPGKLRLPQ